ncbi:hypothetical protein, variant [Puccinia triticina 1-1 BBBD Race 1]|uniref:Uncharacterized protein n=2 Tax=Puccinia triticina TaxID=208348 RepID=A0A180H006_PUCT1|nr:uncharacterized protein PtA15_9A444 [Puccinia triticina]OAV98415.1 hypothetical protein PTTG_25654 [Puccinia triticina 1-1 BBBD Race 1]OAV98416.1 hypothetical protein, variant [Puccinia triticina 1-1 BBBD Race 1]WAQ88317.1 hypothetical protein PtA15_9A444 [Puccinia triticina]WAR60495.1 hypothetical protein PtB15_9B434 [Puccinia triticina]
MFSFFAQRTVLVAAGLPTAYYAANSVISNRKSLAQPGPSSSAQLHFPTVERSNGGI